MEENLIGIRIVRAFSAQIHELSKFNKLSSEVLDISFQRLMAWVRSSTFMGFAFYSAMTVVLWIGGNKVLSGEITLGTLAEFLAFMMILHMPVRQIGMTVNSFARASTCGARFFAILDQTSKFEELTSMPITQLVVCIAGDQGPQIFIEHRDNWDKELIETIDKYNRR